MTTREMLDQNQADIDYIEAQLARGIERGSNRDKLATLESERDALLGYLECEQLTGDLLSWE